MNYWEPVPGLKNVYASINGEIKKKYKTTERLCSQYMKKNNPKAGFLVKVDKKERSVARMVYQAFNGLIPKELVISHKDGFKWNNQIENLEAVTRAESGKRTGGKSTTKIVLKIDRAGNVVKKYNSTREAAKYEYMSRQTISDRCNGKIKKEFDLNGYSYRWRDK